MRECAAHMGIANQSGIARMYSHLEEKGFLSRERGARNIVLHRMPGDPLDELRHLARRIEREYGNAREILERVAGEIGGGPA